LFPPASTTCDRVHFDSPRKDFLRPCYSGGLLAAYPVITTIPILWGDEDAFAHVNNLAYLRWCETARVEYMQRVTFWLELPPNGTGPILASVKCDYKIPLTYPDTVDVGTRVASIGNSSVRMEQIVVSRKLQAVAAIVESTVVMLDYKVNRPVRVPDTIREAIAALESAVQAT
jgi:acyl-CoA thioester hydrolase